MASEVLSGEKADDRVRQGLARAGLLYVGDCKMAAEKTRAHLQGQGNFYLCPLSALHVPPATLAQNVQAYLATGSPLVQVVRESEAGQPKCIAQGYETLVEMQVNQRKVWVAHLTDACGQAFRASPFTCHQPEIILGGKHDLLPKNVRKTKVSLNYAHYSFFLNYYTVFWIHYRKAKRF